MQFRFMGDFQGSGTAQKVAEQCEIWTLEALRNGFKDNVDEAAKLFGASKSILLERMEKYGLSFGDEAEPA